MAGMHDRAEEFSSRRAPGGASAAVGAVMALLASIMAPPARASAADAGGNLNQTIPENKQQAPGGEQPKQNTQSGENGGAPVQLPPISITAQTAPWEQQGPSGGLISPASPIVTPSTASSPADRVNKLGISLLGGPAQVSTFKTLDLMPSVDEASSDPYGISGVRVSIRGQSDFWLAQTVEGVPLTGLVLLSKQLFDLEDVGATDLYRNGVPANQGLGFSDASGALDLHLLEPEEDPGADVHQAFGADEFVRTFARFDSGRLPLTGTRLCVSVSHMSSDKWKGAGGDNRDNVEFGLMQPFGDRVTLKMFGVYNDLGFNDYAPLTYAQTEDLHTYWNFDYNQRLTGNPKQDVNYFDYNREQVTDHALLTELAIKLTDTSSLTFTPYYWNDHGFRLFSVGAGVMRWDIDDQQYGVKAEYDFQLAGADFAAGYWYDVLGAPPPPMYWKLYKPNAAGGLKFMKWALLSKLGDFEMNSPYLMASRAFGDFFLTAGLRYMAETTPSMSYYKTAGLPDTSYGHVFSLNPAPDPLAQVAAPTYANFLPNLSASYNFTPEWSALAEYGRRIGRPDWGPQASNYLNKEAAFKKAGLTLSDVMGRLQPELSDNLDLGVRYNDGRWVLAPSLFASKYYHKEVTLFDPVVNTYYFQSSASATGYGAEMEAAYTPNEWLTVFGSVSYDNVTFDQNLATFSGAVQSTKGKQIPDTPKEMFKLGLISAWRGFSVSPVVRFLGTRYGDVTNTQRIDSYGVTDLNIGYDFGKFHWIQDIAATFTVLNLLDERYIAVVAPNDTDLTSPSFYYVGAPRTFYATIGAKF